MPRILVPLCGVILCTACTDKAGDDSVAPVDTTDSSSPSTVSLLLAVSDIMTEARVPGASVSAEGLSLTADAEGAVTFDVPVNSALVARASAEGWMDSVLQYFSLEEDFQTYIPMLETSVRDGLSAQLGLPYDPSTAMVMVRTYFRDSEGALTHLGGVTVDLDAAYDLALSTDLDARGGLAPTNVTDGDPVAQITFVNVTAGEVAVSLTLPEGVGYCTWYRGDTRVEDWKPTLEADRVNGLFIVCNE